MGTSPGRNAESKAACPQTDDLWERLKVDPSKLPPDVRAAVERLEPARRGESIDPVAAEAVQRTLVNEASALEASIRLGQALRTKTNFNPQS